MSIHESKGNIPGATHQNVAHQNIPPLPDNTHELFPIITDIPPKQDQKTRNESEEKKAKSRKMSETQWKPIFSKKTVALIQQPKLNGKRMSISQARKCHFTRMWGIKFKAVLTEQRPFAPQVQCANLADNGSQE